MQTRPCRLITAPAEHTLQRYGAHPVLLAGQPPHGAKPHSQWRARRLKHRARGHRNLIAAAGALNTARLLRPALAGFTSRTTESVRPAKIEQILPASLLRAEAPLKLQKRPRIILFHGPEHYRLGLPESNGYPVFPNWPQTGPYCLLFLPELICRCRPQDFAVEAASIEVARSVCTGWQNFLVSNRKIIEHRECRQWNRDVAIGSTPSCLTITGMSPQR